MIVCPNCNHQNPDGATQCEACYTPLPATSSCPNCGAMVQTDASFCGQCGFNLKTSASLGEPEKSAPNLYPDLPELVIPDPLVELEPIAPSSQSSMPNPVGPISPTLVSQQGDPPEKTTSPDSGTVPPPPEPVSSAATVPPPLEPVPSQPTVPPPSPASPPTVSPRTQLQVHSAHLFHIQTKTKLELPSHLSVIHVGKPNEQIPPDIDVSGFPSSEIVSRIHADIRVEGDTYYIEDLGSSNGTYINHTPLPPGNRHRLRTGDRISLGKGDQVTFLFQSS